MRGKKETIKTEIKTKTETAAGKRAAASGKTAAPVKRVRKQAAKAVKKEPDNSGVSLRKTPARTGTSRSKKAKAAQNLKIFPIGGLNEIGKNLTALQYMDEILIIDCGMSFPNVGMYGIDVVIPDFTYLVENAAKILGVVVTHGHEDHIGAIPYLLKRINAPVYGTRITLGLIENKLREHGIVADLKPIQAGDTIELGSFKVETVRTTHSVADAICLYISTPAASLFHTGDFKIDYTPIDGEPIDLKKFAEIGDRGVDIMLADSTNALRPGFTKSEQHVAEALDGIFGKAKGRIIIATFSSNVNRVQKIIDLTHKYGRHFAVSGRSMENVVALAQELGYLKVPAGCYASLEDMHSLPDSKIVIITTGSQGEPMSALARMANDAHRSVKLRKGDMVILSSTPVPGNERSVSDVVNRLYDKGVEVIHNEIADIHVSGHACREELKLVHSLIHPHFFMPVHGESRHLVEHGKLAVTLGMPKENVFILRNGDQLSVDHEKAVKFEQVVSAEDVLVDGLGVGDVGNVVLHDRELLSTSGLLVAAAVIDRAAGELVSGPEIVTRGFIYVKEHEDMVLELADQAGSAIQERLTAGITDFTEIKNHMRDRLRHYIYEHTGRSPMILPIVLDA
ncbi:MAG: RNase J family beta-CASP ribonuclease [Firmicutes bacterium]|nr:RNase J family beta-CASP ribonuclease [Bacillota bacterium]